MKSVGWHVATPECRVPGPLALQERVQLSKCYRLIEQVQYRRFITTTGLQAFGQKIEEHQRLLTY